MAMIQLEEVTKAFGSGDPALRRLSLTVADGELMVVVGPSGCGKSTALRLIAGLDAITSGTIRFDGAPINEVSPQARNTAMVFQHYALYPHMRVRHNLAFPLRMGGWSKATIRKQVAETAELLGLTELLDRYPRQLSGGQLQRVAMGRAIVRNPVAFLMDEPLSNLDAKLRTNIRNEIAKLQRRLGVTTIYVTHDQIEAMTLGDRVAVLRDGVLHQVDTPEHLYTLPATAFVAGFLGSPGMNIFRTVLRRQTAQEWSIDFGNHRLPLDGHRVEASPELAAYNGKELLAGLRPEAFIPARGAPAACRLELPVQTQEFLGHEVLTYFQSVVPTVVPETADTSDLPEGRKSPPLVARLPTDMGSNSPSRTAWVGVDTSRLHFFTLDRHARRIPVAPRHPPSTEVTELCAQHAS